MNDNYNNDNKQTSTELINTHGVIERQKLMAMTPAKQL